MTNLIIENICAGYGSVQVLHNVSLKVNEGETVVLLGTNGNGKSTLLKIILGLIKPINGNILVDDAARPQAHVADFRIAHLAVWQTNIQPRA